MSELNITAVENNTNANGDYLLQDNDDVDVYEGGTIPWTIKDNIEHVRIDESISAIDYQAFYRCFYLRTVQFSTDHNLLKNIGNESFYNCYSLLSIDLQNTQIESIGKHAFAFCLELATVQFPATIRKIEEGCFYQCYQLKAVDLSHANCLEEIENGAFSLCYSLKTINLPPTTSSIGKGSFFECKSLEMVDLRATCVKEIGVYTFGCCVDLTNIYFPTTTKCIRQECFSECEELSILDLHTTSVERIEGIAFQYCSELTTINFPKTLKYIGKESFRNCGKLTYLNLRETSIEKIGDRAFCKCINLKMVVGISTSHGEEQLQEEIMDSESFQLPASLVEIGEDTFDECPKLRNSINNNWIHYECDLNRGGRQFLQRHHHHHHHQDNDSNDDGNAKRHGKVYFSSLWPLILHRVMNEMKLPMHRICLNEDNLSLYTSANPVQRQASIAFYLLVFGVVADLQPQAQSGNLQEAMQMQKHEAAAASTSSILSLSKKRKTEW